MPDLIESSFLSFKLILFLFSQINLGINDFQMLMMVVNDNLLEGEHGKLDVSNNSLSAPGGGILHYMAYNDRVLPARSISFAR